MAHTLTSREVYQNALDAEPHYVIHVGESWHSEAYPNRAAAQAWLDGYGVTPLYKELNYRVVNVRKYWEDRSTNKRRAPAL